MKKKILLLVLSLNCLFVLHGQTLPKGMNYQAVARNLKGEILPNETISLKINLVSNADQGRVEHYSETHTAVTNELGLFSLIVGEGKVVDGAFGLIPWSKENIWMEVAIKDKTQTNFSTISNSKLLAVPYAIHAGTANSLVGDNTLIKEDNQTPLESRAAPGVVSTNWSVFGNAKTNTSGNIYRLNSLGTTDFIDLFLVTDNIERMKITAAGDIKTKLNFEVGKSVLLNAVSGSTINNGPFTVDKMSPTLLTGTLTVNKAIKTNDSLVVSGMKPTILTGTLRVDKSTTLNDSLTVTNMKPTVLTGKLRVDKSTNLNDSLSVNNMAPTVLTGKLRVDKSTNLNDSLSVNNMAPTVLTGKLRVDKSTTLNDSLTVTNMKPTVLTGKLRVDKSTNLNDSLSVNNMAPTVLTGKLRVDKSTILNDSLTVAGMKPVHFTGTLVVDKGLSSGASASFTASLKIGDTLTVANMAPTILTGKLRVDKSTTLNDSLTVTGMKPTLLTGTLNVKKVVSLDSFLTVTSNIPDGGYLATFYNTNNGAGDGIKIRLNKNKAEYTIPSSKDTLTVTQLDRIKSLLRCDVSVADKGTNLANIVLDGTLQTLAFVGGLSVALGNTLIDVINDGIGLPLNLATPINSSLGLPINISGPINSGMGLPVNISGPINSGLGLPINFNNIINSMLGLPLGLPQIEVFPDIEIAGPYYIGPFTIVPSIPATPAIEIPALPAFSIPALPPFSIPALPSNFAIPAIPTIDLTSLGIPLINFDSLDLWGVPNLCLTDITSLPLNNENVFIRFTDAADLKLGSVRAVSVADWAIDYLNPVFLYGLYEAITSSIVDKKHALYHFKIEVKKALLAYAKIGVEYSSGSGDYAEWLMRINAEESINKGDIVGVIGGKISKDLKDAEQVMAISHSPIVLGNVPPEGKVGYGNSVAFMGQIPVKIIGPVASGDYIVGNDNTPGYGLAIHPSDMKIGDFKFAVGRSWETNLSGGPKMVNTVIGVHNGDYIKILKKYEEKFEKTESRIQSLEQKVEALLEKSNH